MAFNVLWFEQVGFIDDQFLTAGVLTAIIICPVYPICLALYRSVHVKNRSKRYLAKTRREETNTSVGETAPRLGRDRRIAPDTTETVVTEPFIPRSRQRIEVESNIDNSWTSAPLNAAPREMEPGPRASAEDAVISNDDVVELPALGSINNSEITSSRVRIL